MGTIELQHGLVTHVDDEDMPKLAPFTWRAVTSANMHYAYTYMSIDGIGVKERVMLANFLLNPPEDMVVDHIDFDTLNNRRSNLRVATRQQNLWHRRSRKDGKPRSKTGYRGVSEYGTRFRAAICVDGKQLHIGVFDTALEAARAYDRDALYYHGDFAVINGV